MISLGSLKNKIISIYKKNELFCNLAILTILFFLNCFMWEMSFATFSFLFVFVMISNIANGFTYIVYTIPFCMVGGEISGYLYIAVFATYVLKGYVKLIFIDKLKLDKKFLIVFLIFAVYLLLPFDGINGYNDQLIIKFIVVIGLMLFALLMTKYPKEFRIKINVNICAVALVISVMFFGTYFISDHLQNITKLFYVGDFIRFQALLTNPNILAMACEICLALLVYFILSSKISWVEIVSFVIFAVVGFSTMSKTFLILLTIMLIVLILYFLIKKPFYALCLITSLCAIVVLLVAIKPDMFLTYFERFVKTSGDSGIDNPFDWAMSHLTTGRYDLWLSYIQYMLQYPMTLFFGATLGAGQLGGNSPHNIYISSFYQFGLIGTIIFFTAIILLCKDFKKNHPLMISKWIVIPIIIMAMLVCVEDLFMFIYD